MEGFEACVVVAMHLNTVPSTLVQLQKIQSAVSIYARYLQLGH